MRTILMAFIMALATQVSAEDLSTDNYSTDNKLLSEVKTRMVLENGLVVHIWEWNEKAKALGLDKHPPAGLIAQDVELMYPDAIVKDENGYLMVDLPVLMDMDDLIAKLVLESGGVARLVQGASGAT
ncbi:MAG: hypothetical protein P8I79_05725 [Amylibacter sp.]|nr:hypothetical protein [Amylibacter sp.]